MDLFLGCWHQNRSFPITVREKSTGEAETYAVCLECGKKLPYSWEQMRVVRPSRPKKAQATEAQGLGAWVSRHRWSSRGM
jgi:hypothetical protein